MRVDLLSNSAQREYAAAYGGKQYKDPVGGLSGESFTQFNRQIKEHFKDNASIHKLFKLKNSNIGAMAKAYISALRWEEKSHHTCNCCFKFLDNYGDLVYINDDGDTVSAIWDEQQYGNYGIYTNVVMALSDLAWGREVSGEFLTKEETLGARFTNGWEHFSLDVPVEARLKGTKTAYQAMCAKKEDYRILNDAMTKYSRKHVQTVLTLCKTESVVRNQKIKDRTAWLLEAYDIRENARGLSRCSRDNLLWKMIASAPAGWPNVSSSVLGSLLDDLVKGIPLKVILKRFADKMDALKYMRPTKEASSQAIDKAEEIFAEMGYGPSLPRRFARPEEVNCIWYPKPQCVSRDQGLFSSLRTDNVDKPLKDGTLVSITLEKFIQKVVPLAQAMRAKVTSGHQNFQAFCTADNPDAKSMFQWNNQFSTFVYSGGSPGSAWSLDTGWIDVTGMSYKPSHWDTNIDAPIGNQANAVSFLLKDATPTRNAGLALFPETLKADLHEVRRVIEQFSNKGVMGGKGSPAAVGLTIGQSGSDIIYVDVDMGTITKSYCISGWE